MDFSQALICVAGLICLEKRVSYRRLRSEFGLDDQTLEDVRHELIVKRVAVDEDGQALAFVSEVGAGSTASTGPSLLPATTQSSAAASASISAGTLARTDTALNTTWVQAAERRQLTVMFCDLVGSTALSTQMDPEDLRDVITSFQDQCREAIRRYDGFIARYMGDGVLVYFGYPQAHENDAERAIRAGLDILASMTALNRDVHNAQDKKLAVRVGVATGPVVVGDLIGEGAAEEAAVVGETPNLAARLQGIAQPNQMVISPATQRIVGGVFMFEDLGSHELKGIPTPTQAWRVTGTADIEVRHETDRHAGSSPLVGRHEELGLLLRGWESAREGRGQVVLIQGEAGVGKSRLLEALREPFAEEEYVWVSIRCSPYHASAPLFPVIEHFKRVAMWQPEDDAQLRLEKLETSLGAQSMPLDDAAPLFAELLSLPLPEGRYPAIPMTPQQKREATFDAIVGWLLELAESKPVMQVWEDLHWADPTTLELLGLYIEQSPTVSMLNVLTYRPEFVPPWAMRSHMTPITLNRLERPEVEAFVNRLARGRSLPSEVLEHVVSKADGVPLYIEELTKAIIESGVLRVDSDRYVLDGKIAELQIPSTLQDSLMARLDRAPELREIAQMAAVLGREFPYEMLKLLAGRDEGILRATLEELVSDELLFQRGRPPRSRYIFKHALIQDAAYQSLLNRSRQAFHRQVADMLESQFPELAASQPELIAHHYTESGQNKEALEHWSKAGANAMGRWATGETVSHLRAGLRVLAELPASAERDRRELEIQTALGPALLASCGFSEPTLGKTYQRASELCEFAGDHRQTCLALRGQQIYHFAIGELEDARRIAGQLLQRAFEKEEIGYQVGGSHAEGQCLFLLGEFSDAQKVLEKGIEVAGTEPMTVADWPGGQPAEQCHLYAGFVSWALGFPDRALEQVERGLALSEALENPISLLNSEAFVAAVYWLRRDAQNAGLHAERTISLCQQHGHPTFLGYASTLHGASRAMQNHLDDGIEEMERGIEEWCALHMRLWVPMMSIPLVEAYAASRAFKKGLNALSQWKARVANTGERAWDAEFHRLQAELINHEPEQTKRPIACLKEALRIARAQQAKSFELRAATALARLWSRNDRPKEGFELLEPIYNWFTEGFDTADLVDARTLLEELG